VIVPLEAAGRSPPFDSPPFVSQTTQLPLPVQFPPVAPMDNVAGAAGVGGGSVEPSCATATPGTDDPDAEVRVGNTNAPTTHTSAQTTPINSRRFTFVPLCIRACSLPASYPDRRTLSTKNAYSADSSHQ